MEISRKIDKSKSNEAYVDITDFDDEFNFNFDYIEQERLKAYWIGNWYCTDSYVGWRMYFLDEEPVAVSSQLGRKSSETFEWFSRELALKVKAYLISIMVKQNEDELNIKLCNLNEDVGDSYKIEFNSQILDYKNVVYQGKSVEILERIKDNPDWGIEKNLRVKLPNGNETVLNVNELDFKYHLTQ